MGDKSKARETAKAAGVPIIPGSEGPLRTADEALDVAKSIGFPIILKAAAGGGGRGMRICWDETELQTAYETARSEAERAFGVADVYLEKYLERPRHIEIQVFGDSFGRIVSLGERECSIQRRHQKLIEESPSPAIDPDTRKRMGDAAIALCRAVDYVNAGTIEFLFQDGKFYFMEMNTRVQVEHPVTELVTGIDIVKEQIRIAQGDRLRIAQDEVHLTGHAIECRINAEDPARDFAPSPGQVQSLRLPGGPGIRIDSHMFEGYRVPPYYDSLVAKVIAWGHDRAEACARMRRALSEMTIEGIHTTIPFHLRLLADERFVRGDVHTRFVEDELMRAA
jgi:acetyl-CoA carboxylase biotin carboxylase subunit